MGCINLIFGAILPRLALLSGWSNDPVYWNNLFGSQVLLGLGFIALPWTTLIYGFVAPTASRAQYRLPGVGVPRRPWHLGDGHLRGPQGVLELPRDLNRERAEGERPAERHSPLTCT